MQPFDFVVAFPRHTHGTTLSDAAQVEPNQRPARPHISLFMTKAMLYERGVSGLQYEEGTQQEYHES